MVSPVCPKCDSANTYDFSQEYKTQEPVPFQPYTIGNAKYHCNDCGHEWKKYRGRKPYEKLRIIDVHAGGYMDYGTANRVEINLRTGHVCHALMFGEFSANDPVRIMDGDEVDWFLEELYKCDFINWAQEYHVDGVLDGGFWQVRIEYDTYCEIKIGSNHYPKKWTRFCKAVSGISGNEFY